MQTSSEENNGQTRFRYINTRHYIVFKTFHIIQVLLCTQLFSFQVNKRLYCNDICFCSKYTGSLLLLLSLQPHTFSSTSCAIVLHLIQATLGWSHNSSEANTSRREKSWPIFPLKIGARKNTSMLCLFPPSVLSSSTTFKFRPPWVEVRTQICILTVIGERALVQVARAYSLVESYSVKPYICRYTLQGKSALYEDSSLLFMHRPCMHFTECQTTLPCTSIDWTLSACLYWSPSCQNYSLKVADFAPNTILKCKFNPCKWLNLSFETSGTCRWSVKTNTHTHVQYSLAIMCGSLRLT